MSDVQWGSISGIALRADRTVAWLGSATYGQDLIPPELGFPKQVATSGDHCVALSEIGEVFCWGRNSTLQCTLPAGLGPCTLVAAGQDFTAAVRVDGSAVCWGSNLQGQCQVPGLSGPITSIACGSQHSVVRLAAGQVLAWGANSGGQATPPPGLEGVETIAAGQAHSLALRADGTVICWGANSAGQCDVPADLRSVRALAGGSDFSLALRTDGTVTGWGNLSYGRGEFLASIDSATLVRARGSSIAVRLDTDCNADGVPDSTEPGFHDCNGNGLHDSCEAAVDALEDCNNNGLGDSCEKQLTVSLASGEIGPIGYTKPVVWTIPDAVLASEPVRLRVRGHGDFSGQLESVTVKVGSLVAGIALAGTNDCGVTPWSSFTLPDAFFNGAVAADGSVTIRADAAIAVDAFGCSDGTWLEFELDYVGASSADCNANGLLDSCEIAAGWAVDANGNGVIDICEQAFSQCPADFDQNGAVDAADLAQLLNAWGPAASVPGLDLIPDGIINGADLAELLNSWGVCIE